MITEICYTASFVTSLFHTPKPWRIIIISVWYSLVLMKPTIQTCYKLPQILITNPDLKFLLSTYWKLPEYATNSIGRKLLDSHNWQNKSFIFLLFSFWWQKLYSDQVRCLFLKIIPKRWISKIDASTPFIQDWTLWQAIKPICNGDSQCFDNVSL